MKYTNQNNVPLPIAVWLATDTYKHSDDPYTISATTLLKPIKQLVLSKRITEESSIELAALLNSKIGTAVHDSVEKAWQSNFIQAMLDIGYTEGLAKRIKLNPKLEELTTDILPVYTELRTTRKLGKWTISGELDFAFNGQIYDFKTTKVFSYIKKSNDDDYIKQMSIYAWLNESIVTKDIGSIIYIFKDWKGFEVNKPNYPQAEILEYKLPLMTSNQIQSWIENRLSLLEHYIKLPQSELPDCTNEELWQDPPQYKYYANPDKLIRATKNFDSYVEAHTYMVTKGKGIIITKEGEPKRCGHCPAFTICEQAKRYIDQGIIK